MGLKLSKEGRTTERKGWGDVEEERVSVSFNKFAHVVMNLKAF
jgi:hypothetical protein